MTQSLLSSLMEISRRRELYPYPALFSHLETLASDLQRWKHTCSGETKVTPSEAESSILPSAEGPFDTSAWKTADSRTFGITRSMISSPIWTVLKILHVKGFEAYLVGGCVRDLLLKRMPKDYDVVTTASLKEIKMHFYRCRVIGRRFPICQVYVLGSMVEVSSFLTISENEKGRKTKTKQFSQMPSNCDEKDFIRWKDCMRRDFTINSLFYDPFAHTIYDYVNGIRDIMAFKVRTVVPAHLSFKEDCARILRGLRIVARLGFRFSKETSAAVENLSSSIMSLTKERLMMELNFMLAYGAAESSIRLLQEYKLLEILLPIQAAYLTDQTKNQSGGRSIMLMKLFSSADKLLAADHPSSCSLWLGILAFHLTLVEHPQNAIVVWTLASILYHGTWNESVQYVRGRIKYHTWFVPELLEPFGTQSDDSLVEETLHLVSMVKSSAHALLRTEALQQVMARYQMSLPCSGLIFVSGKAAKSVTGLFDVLETDIKSYSHERKSRNIDYELLKKGDAAETRFVLGKVILDTMNNGIIQEQNADAVKKMKEGIIQKENQKAIAAKEMKEGVIQKENENEVAVYKMKDGIIRKENQNTLTVEKMKDSIIQKENQNAVTVKKSPARLSSLFR